MPTKLAYYIPTEYSDFEDNFFEGVIIDCNENGLGILLKRNIPWNIVYNIMPASSEEFSQHHQGGQTYQSSIKWAENTIDPINGTFRVGMQHI